MMQWSDEPHVCEELVQLLATFHRPDAEVAGGEWRVADAVDERPVPQQNEVELHLEWQLHLAYGQRVAVALVRTPA